MAIPEPKSVQPFTYYSGKLSLGDWRKYPESALYIDVKRYSKTTKANPPSASSFVATNGGASAQSSGTLAEDVKMTDAPSSTNDLAPVKNTGHYVVKSEKGTKGVLDVEREDLARGYEYGRTAVAMNESDEIVTKLETFAEFTIIGFIPSDQVCGPHCFS
jgi:ATP-dependent DNA helicase 2 subunit 2